MRHVVVLVIGLLVGALLATSATNALRLRHAKARSLMTMMQYAIDDARRAAHEARCNAPDVRSAAALLGAASDRLATAVGPELASERVFRQSSDALRSAVAAWDPAAPCAEQASAIRAVSDACDACHRDYR